LQNISHWFNICKKIMVSYSRSPFNSDVENDLLKFSLPVSPYVNAHRKTALNIHFIYSGNKEIYYVFKTC